MLVFGRAGLDECVTPPPPLPGNDFSVILLL